MDRTQRFEAWGQLLHAFVGPTHTAQQPSVETGAQGDGALSGTTFGVKDIIDVAGVPTRNGSRTCTNARAADRDAGVVRLLKNAGAVFIGKTTTTEFAFTDPTDCRNPHDLARSPGGSSSGSGAAVAAGLLDFALGTQTAGSLCRPAAYCGVVAFKPTYGAVPTTGVTPLAPSFDTIGVIARNVDMARRCGQVMAPSASGGSDFARGVAALIGTDIVPNPETLEAFYDANRALKTLATDSNAARLPVDAHAVVADHRTVMTFEAYRHHKHLLAEGAAAQLQPKFLAGLQAGAAVSYDEAADAASRLADARNRFWASLSDVDVVLTLPVPDGAPLIGDTTGFQDWLTPWTVFGGPLVCLPWGMDGIGRPRSVMLAGHPGKDVALLDMAARVEELAPPMPAPVPPAD